MPTVTSPEESLGQRWKRYSHIALSSALLLLADVGMKTSMNGLNIQFPHTLAGMLILSIGLIAAKSAKGASGKAADAVLEFFQPLLAWVARWMPVFFVPALIALPMSLATASVQASDFLKVGQVLVLGWTSSMLLVTVALKALRSLFHTELTDQEVRSCHTLASCLKAFVRTLARFQGRREQQTPWFEGFWRSNLFVHVRYDRWCYRPLPLHPSL